MIVKNEPNLSDLRGRFKSGFICKFELNATNLEFWYFDGNKLISLESHDSIVQEKINQLRKIIQCKRKAPAVTNFTNAELQIASECLRSRAHAGGLPFKRAIGRFGPREIKDSIREVVFGFNISKRDVDFILGKLKNMQTKFYVVKPVIGEYRLEIHPFNNYEDDIKSYQRIYGYSNI